MEERVLLDIKTKSTCEGAFKWDELATGYNHESSNNKKTLVLVFHRFLTHVLSLKLRKTYFYIFQVLFFFFLLQAIPLPFWGLESIHSILH